MSGELVPRDPLEAINKKFQHRISYWKELYASATEEQIKATAPAAITELDKLWSKKGLMNKDSLVSGRGLWTETIPEDELTDVDQDNILITLPKIAHYTVVRFGAVVNLLGHSQGLSLVAFEDEDRSSLAYQFLRPESYGGNGVYTHYQIDHRIQVRVGTLSLLTVEDIQAKLNPLNQRFEPQCQNKVKMSGLRKVKMSYS